MERFAWFDALLWLDFGESPLNCESRGNGVMVAFLRSDVLRFFAKSLVSMSVRHDNPGKIKPWQPSRGPPSKYISNQSYGADNIL